MWQDRLATMQMISSEKISSMIQSLQEYASTEDLDLEILRQKNKDLFLHLLQTDSIFFLAAISECSADQLHDKSFRPYIAQATQQSKLPYLRIFSDRAMTEAFAKSVNLPPQNCVPLSAVESAQLAKYWFTHGVYGYMLNDGSTWATISFHDYLSMLFCELLGRPDMCNEEYTYAMNLLIILECQEPIKIEKENEIIIVSASEEPNHSTTIPSFLDDCQNATEIHVSLPLLQFKTTSATLSLAAKEFHPYSQESHTSFPFKQESYVNLDYSPSDDIQIVSPFTSELEQNPTKEVVTEVSSSLSPKPKEPFFQAFLSQFQQIKPDSILSKFKKNNDIHPESEEKPLANTEENKQSEDLTAENHSELDPTPELQQPSNNPNRKRKKRNISLTTFLFIGFVFVGALFLVFLIKNTSPIHSFTKALANHQFVQAYAIYEAHKKEEVFDEESTEILEDEINTILDLYAKNELDATTAAAQLREYEIFPHISAYYAKAMQQAAILEQSKNAAVFGSQAIEKGNYLQGLEVWKSVIPQDIVNYEAIQKSIRKNEDLYISSGLLACSQYLNEGKQEYYKAGIELLHYWFPSNTSITKAYTEFSSGSISFNDESDTSFSVPSTNEEAESASNNHLSNSETELPIIISKCSVSLPQSNGSISLYIDWVNTSDRVIKEISFLVQAKDEFGNEMFCYKGEYSMFQAVAEGPWSPGEGMDHDTSFWKNAWYNSRICQVNLLQVNITFSDGESVQISDPTRLLSS